MVNGRVINVYSKRDNAVKLFNYLMSQNSFGSNCYFQNDPENASNSQLVGEKTFRFENYDVSTFVGDHLNYRKTLDLVLEFTNYES